MEGSVSIAGCAYCSDRAEYDLAGLPHCPRCALRYIVLSMQAELLSDDNPSVLTRDVLVKH